MERRGVYLAVSVVAPWLAIVGAGAWAAVVSRELWHLASGGGAIGLAVAGGLVAYGTPGQQPGWSRARLLGYASRAGPWRFLSGARTSNAASSRRRQKPSMARSNASLPGAGTTGCGTALIAFRTRSGVDAGPDHREQQRLGLDLQRGDDTGQLGDRVRRLPLVHGPPPGCGVGSCPTPIAETVATG